MTIHPWKYGNEYNIIKILFTKLKGLVAEWTKALCSDAVADNFVSSNPTTFHSFILLLSNSPISNLCKGAFTYDVRCFLGIFDLPTLIRYFTI